MVVIVLRHAAAGECGVEEDPRAGVAYFAVGVGGGSPVGAGVGELLGLGVEEVDFCELGRGELHEVVFEEGVHLRVVGDVLGGEDCSFVCVVAVRNVRLFLVGVGKTHPKITGTLMNFPWL